MPGKADDAAGLTPSKEDNEFWNNLGWNKWKILLGFNQVLLPLLPASIPCIQGRCGKRRLIHCAVQFFHKSDTAVRRMPTAVSVFLPHKILCIIAGYSVAWFSSFRAIAVAFPLFRALKTPQIVWQVSGGFSDVLIIEKVLDTQAFCESSSIREPRVYSPLCVFWLSLQSIFVIPPVMDVLFTATIFSCWLLKGSVSK